MGSWVEIATGHAPSTYIFAGMGAFVAGCSRTPITALFLAFALTKNLLIMKPVLISCIASFLIARAFNEESIYERQIQIELEEYGTIFNQKQQFCCCKQILGDLDVI